MGRRNKKGKTRAGHRRRGHEGRKNNCEAQSKQQNKRVVQGKNRKREQEQIQSPTPIGWDKKNWEPQKRANYMKKLTRPQASIIFKARSRMLPVKNNFRNKHQTQTCRACGNHTETQQHVLEECEVLHLVGEFKVYSNEIFSNNTNNLKTTATNIKCILDQLHNQPTQKEGTTTTTTCTTQQPCTARPTKDSSPPDTRGRTQWWWWWWSTRLGLCCSLYPQG